MVITKEQAMTLGEFYHVSHRNKDGTAVRCRSNGMCKTWKRQPDRFQLPVKHGLRGCFYIFNGNAQYWLSYDPTEEYQIDEHRERIDKQLTRLRKKYKLDQKTPWPILRDYLADKGEEATVQLIDGTLRSLEQRILDWAETLEKYGVKE